MLTGDETDEEAIAIVKKNTKAELCSITKVLGIDSLNQFRRTYLPKSLYEQMFFVLDTDDKSPDLSTKYTFAWRIVSNNTFQSGAINCPPNMRDIIGMHIFPVSMYWGETVQDPADKKILVNELYNPNNNFTILIHEMQAQSYIGRDGRKFHFAMAPLLQNPMFQTSSGTSRYKPDFTFPCPADTPPDPHYEMINTGKCNGWFWFNNPITEITTITISIGSPFDLISNFNTTLRVIIPIQFIYLNDKKYLSGGQTN
jgi:hypothetical protein